MSAPVLSGTAPLSETDAKGCTVGMAHHPVNEGTVTIAQAS